MITAEKKLTNNSRRKRVIIHVQFGLSNRLRAIASAWNFSRKHDRDIIVIWEPDVHCDCKFNDLFIEHDLKVYSSNLFDLKNTDCYDYMNAPLRRSNKLQINHDTVNDIYIKSAYTLDYKLYDLNEENIFLKTLNPIPKVNKTVSQYNLSDTIGLHIRMGGGINYDKDRWDSDEFLDDTSKKLMNHWREKSHFDVFLRQVERILHTTPSQKFYLAADLAKTYEILKVQFSDSITYYPRSLFDRSRDQQITALIDLYCLSKTKQIYGSTWSSFSEIAARLNETPIKLSGVDF